jgi:hypothetical protein
MKWNPFLFTFCTVRTRSKLTRLETVTRSSCVVFAIPWSVTDAARGICFRHVDIYGTCPSVTSNATHLRNILGAT